MEMRPTPTVFIRSLRLHVGVIDNNAGELSILCPPPVIIIGSPIDLLIFICGMIDAVYTLNLLIMMMINDQIDLRKCICL